MPRSSELMQGRLDGGCKLPVYGMAVRKKAVVRHNWLSISDGVPGYASRHSQSLFARRQLRAVKVDIYSSLSARRQSESRTRSVATIESIVATPVVRADGGESAVEVDRHWRHVVTLFQREGDGTRRDPECYSSGVLLIWNGVLLTIAPISEEIW
jgi:hypothetical protein